MKHRLVDKKGQDPAINADVRRGGSKSFHVLRLGDVPAVEGPKYPLSLIYIHRGTIAWTKCDNLGIVVCQANGAASQPSIRT